MFDKIEEMRYWVEWQDTKGRGTCRLCDCYEKACILANIVNKRHLKRHDVKLTAIALFGTI